VEFMRANQNDIKRQSALKDVANNQDENALAAREILINSEAECERQRVELIAKSAALDKAKKEADALKA